MNWNHKTIFQAIATQWPRRMKKTDKGRHYVKLYEAKTNCAILYASGKRPLHLHPGQNGWQADMYMKILPTIGVVQLEKRKGSQRWLKCNVVDWDKFADALGLLLKE